MVTKRQEGWSVLNGEWKEFEEGAEKRRSAGKGEAKATLAGRRYIRVLALFWWGHGVGEASSDEPLLEISAQAHFGRPLVGPPLLLVGAAKGRGDNHLPLLYEICLLDELRYLSCTTMLPSRQILHSPLHAQVLSSMCHAIPPSYHENECLAQHPGIAASRPPFHPAWQLLHFR